MSARAPLRALSTALAPFGGRVALRAAWGSAPLKERLGRGAGAAESDSPSSTAPLARIAFYLLSLGATATLGSLAFDVRNEVGVAACAVAAYGLALLCLAGYDRLPQRAFQVISCAASVVVTFGLYYGGPASTFYQQFYVWIALFAAYHFRPLAATFQAIVIGVAYGVVLGFTDSAAAPVSWFLTMATLLVAGIITIVLHRRVRVPICVVGGSASRRISAARNLLNAINVGTEGAMSLVRLLGFTTLGCGCVVGRYREVARRLEG